MEHFETQLEALVIWLYLISSTCSKGVWVDGFVTYHPDAVPAPEESNLTRPFFMGGPDSQMNIYKQILYLVRL